MAIILRGKRGASGHVTAVPDTEYILLTRDGSPDVMEILDVGNGDPTVSGTYNFSGTGDVFNPVVYGDRAYVFDNNGSDSALWVLDISDVDNGNITLSGSVTVEDNPTAYGYVADGQYVYYTISSSVSSPRRLYIRDVTDVTSMSLIGQSPNNDIFDTPTRLMFHPVNSNYLIAVKADTAVVANTTVKTAPTVDYTADASLFTQVGYVWCGTQYYADSGKGYLFMGYRDPGGIEVYDITNPDTSTWAVVDDLHVEGVILSIKFEIMGNYLYSSWEEKDVDNVITYYIRVVDISDPENLALVDSLLTDYKSNDQTFVQKSGGDPIFITSYADNGKTVAYTVPVSAYKYSGTLSHDAHIYVLNPNNMTVYRDNEFSAGTYEFPATADQTPRHVLAERNSDGALLVYADVIPVLYSSS